MIPQATHQDSIRILDDAGARQWIDKDGVWLIAIPRNNDKPRVQWALRDVEAAAGKNCCVLWVKRTG